MSDYAREMARQEANRQEANRQDNARQQEAQLRQQQETAREQERLQRNKDKPCPTCGGPSTTGGPCSVCLDQAKEPLTSPLVAVVPVPTPPVEPVVEAPQPEVPRAQEGAAADQHNDHGPLERVAGSEELRKVCPSCSGKSPQGGLCQKCEKAAKDADGLAARLPERAPDRHAEVLELFEEEGGSRYEVVDDDGPAPDEEPDRIPELDELGVRPSWCDNVDRGNDFNEARKWAYDYRELYLVNGRYVDGYTAGEEIVSRKHTQIASLRPQWADYLVNELLDKYGAGNVVADSKGNREKCPELVGKPLRGCLVLEVPVQDKPVPAEYCDWARRLGIVIRDDHGLVYTGAET